MGKKVTAIQSLVMFQSSVLDRGPPGPRVFWEDRDRTKTDPQRPKDRQSFLVLKLANFLRGFLVNFWYFYYLWVKHLFWPHALFHLMIRDGGAVQVHEKIIDKNVMVSWVGQNYTLGIVFSIIYGP